MKHLVLVLLICCVMPLQAQEYRNFNVFKKGKNAIKNEKIALVIANGEYQHGRLEKPVPEAQNIVEALTAKGYDVEVGYNLDQAAMKQTIINFSRQFTQYKSGIVYYAGHGFQIAGANYLVPTDTPQTDNLFELKSALVELDYVFEAIDDMDKPKLVILDACRNNPFKERLAAAYRSADDNGFSEIRPQINGKVLFSTGPGTKVSDDNPFTRMLSEEIQMGGCLDDITRRLNRRIREADPTQIITERGQTLDPELCFGMPPKPDPKPDPIDPTPPNPGPNNGGGVDVTQVEDALSWLQGRFTEVRYSRYYRTGMLSHNYTRSYDYKLDYNAANCQLVLEVTNSYVEDRSSLRNDTKRKNRYTMKLSDISSVEWKEGYSGNHAFVIKTYNGQELIKEESLDYEHTSMVNELTLDYSTLGDLGDEYQRILNAFNDALAGCGAKKEKY